MVMDGFEKGIETDKNKKVNNINNKNFLIYYYYYYYEKKCAVTNNKNDNLNLYFANVVGFEKFKFIEEILESLL